MWWVYFVWIGSQWGYFQFNIRFSHWMYQVIPTSWHKTTMAWRLHWNVEENRAAWSSNNSLWTDCNGEELDKSNARNHSECRSRTNINACTSSFELLFFDGSRNGPIAVEFNWYDITIQKRHPMSLDLQCTYQYKTWRKCLERHPRNYKSHDRNLNMVKLYWLYVILFKAIQWIKRGSDKGNNQLYYNNYACYPLIITPVSAKIIISSWLFHFVTFHFQTIHWNQFCFQQCVEHATKISITAKLLKKKFH